MSLRGFHLIFITIAAIFCAGFGMWALLIEQADSGLGMTLFGGVALAAAAGLLFYGISFFRKAKNLLD